MPLFRFHRGGLHDSLATTVIVKNIKELNKIVYEALKEWFWKLPTDIELTIEPYPDENCFDARIGWYTHMVLAKVANAEMSPIGFLSEPL